MEALSLTDTISHRQRKGSKRSKLHQISHKISDSTAKTRFTINHPTPETRITVCYPSSGTEVELNYPSTKRPTRHRLFKIATSKNSSSRQSVYFTNAETKKGL